MRRSRLVFGILVLLLAFAAIRIERVPKGHGAPQEFAPLDDLGEYTMSIRWRPIRAIYDTTDKLFKPMFLKGNDSENQ